MIMEPNSLGLPEKGISTMAGKDDCSFLRKESLIYFRKLELILQGCCAKLPTRNRFNESASALLPEKFNMTDSTGESLKCSFTLVGDNVAKAEITVRHPKLPSHFYRAVVQPDIQWKLQQVQDLGNYVLLAMEMLRYGMLTLQNCNDNELSVEKLFWVTKSIRNYLFAARDVFVYAPKKGPFSQIHDERLKKCFVPSPPADLMFNLYISSSKLNFNVIYSPAQPSEKDSLQVYECECHVPWFADLIYIVTSAIQLTQLFTEKVSTLFLCKSTLSPCSR
ncbi:hypothetical protein M514_01697 [Trichuris suis]|uniref:Protein rogdi homolog n=1 Tax=Trichuris suis TaxID=68888 RepID=A0A085MK48_9BILA|nr:hypothetical protein M513_01697 [Trichuris suis]KFD72379.1 hypothetical protein M514_01697 [Trichuris suis]